MTPSVNHDIERPLLSESEFIAGFHSIGEERYHHKHPFHSLMHEGRLTRGQLQAWALNRYYYQSRIPIKDAAILARSEDPGFRVAWRKRILDHDGDDAKPGGIEKWLRLVEATGLWIACASTTPGSPADWTISPAVSPKLRRTPSSPCRGS